MRIIWQLLETKPLAEYYHKGSSNWCNGAVVMFLSEDGWSHYYQAISILVQTYKCPHVPNAEIIKGPSMVA